MRFAIAIDYTQENTNPLSHLISDLTNYQKIRTPYAIIHFVTKETTQYIYPFENEKYIGVLYGEVFDHAFIDGWLEAINTQGLFSILQAGETSYSAVLYDKSLHRVSIIRDRIGLHSMYTYEREDIVLISNRLRAFNGAERFEKKINFNVLGQYLQVGYIQQPHTIFEDTYKLPAAHIGIFSLPQKQRTTTPYWSLRSCYEHQNIEDTEENIIETIDTLLQNEVNKYRKIDAIGSFLSGGIDSSAITSQLVKSGKSVHTFTAGFEDEACDEAPHAKKIASYLKTMHHEYYFGTSMLNETIKQFAKVYDEPLGDKAALPTMAIYQNASKHVKILYGGEGGDELFCSSGFLDKYLAIVRIPYLFRKSISYLLRWLQELIPLREVKFEKWALMMAQKNPVDILKYKDITMTFEESDRVIKADIDPLPLNLDDVSTFVKDNHYKDYFAAMIHTYVRDNLLTKVTASANYFDILPQTPYLQKELFRYVSLISPKLHHKHGINKYLLKKVLVKYLPQNLIEKPKQGFSVPVGKMLKTSLQGLLDEYINEDRIVKEGIFDAQEVMALKHRFLTSDSYYDEQNIWNIFVFELWYEAWFEDQ